MIVQYQIGPYCIREDRWLIAEMGFRKRQAAQFVGDVIQVQQGTVGQLKNRGRKIDG